MFTVQAIKGKLRADGWAITTTVAGTQEHIAAEVQSLASKLGDIVPGRGGQLVELVVPETVETARTGSLSSKFGLRPLPLHTDTAHWNVPCRYLALACVDPGPTPTPTCLLDSMAIRLSDSESLACLSAVFAIKNGRFSFYGSIMDRDRPFIRLDPGCMTPLSSEGAVAFEAFSIHRHANSLQRHDWKRGDVLLLDNWRILHGRGHDAPTERGRILIRTMIQ